MSKRQRNYSALWVRDKKGINLIVLFGYIVCALMYGGIGYFVFSSGIGGDEPWKPILYYLLLVLPILSSLFDYKNVVNTDEFRYALYLPSLVFYLYLILFDYQYMYFIYAVFLICMSVIFLDMKFLLLPNLKKMPINYHHFVMMWLEIYVVSSQVQLE